MSQKIITVFGATGNQGGSTASAIFNNSNLASKYKVRAITRDPSKPAAQALAAKGAELAQADINDVESVKAAVAGAYGVFAVTNYWETQDKNAEIKQGKNVVDACKAEGVKHLIWSTLPHAGKLTNGELSKIEHFESKAEVAEYAEQVKGEMLVSYFMPGYFMSNLTKQFKPADSGIPTLSLPWNPHTTWVPMLDIQKDTGLFTMGLLEAGSAANGVYVQGVSEWLRPQEFVDQLATIKGKDIRFEEVPASVESIAKIGNKVAEEIQENMLLIRDWSYYGKGAEKNQAESDKYLLPGSKKVTWKEFAESNQWPF
ncbi:NmrA-like family domain-containing protein 1 [Cladophialophora carrionii]|uniref:NmrA-like family domain-containing protein 1 n=1 Tax=Cladophialophora carrionii TaxID=86049 RepID=A0A1C1CFU5_9EURO|nr:NmrA-like family domain-containing protein 1 [Cladophialophora carrionii]